MQKNINQFQSYLDNEDRYACVDFALSGLKNGDFSITQLYEEILKPSLNRIGSPGSEGKTSIWQEHVKSSIVRTIIENCYIYVIKEREKRNFNSGKKALVLCPDGENHEIGARMVTDFMTLYGIDAIFIGSSTPKEEFIDAVQTIRPDVVSISVTNYLNLVSAKKTIAYIREKSGQDMMIVVGGSAFCNNPGIFRELGADRLINSIEDIQKLAGEGGAE